jgi:hypothetical protein
MPEVLSSSSESTRPPLPKSLNDVIAQNEADNRLWEQIRNSSEANKTDFRALKAQKQQAFKEYWNNTQEQEPTASDFNRYLERESIHREITDETNTQVAEVLNKDDDSLLGIEADINPNR